MSKLSFVIVSPLPFTRRWGGVCALFKLAEALERRDELVSVLIEPDREKRGRLAVDPSVVVILPEIYAYEPTGAKNVVRWILNIPALSGTGDGYGSDDLIFLWSTAFAFDSKSPPAGLLFTTEWHHAHLKNRREPRKGTCHLVRKGHGKPLDKHPADSLSIDDYCDRGGIPYLADVFNSRERFICYDHATQLSTYAAICGCEVVVIPDGVRSVDQAIADDPQHTMLAGVAWGFEDLPRARLTAGSVPLMITASEESSDISIDQFVRTCYERFAH